jgi:phospholipid transport system substrate-binding protein
MSLLTRRVLLLSAGLAAVSFRGNAVAADDAGITDPIQGLYAGLEAAMRAGKATPFQQRFDALAPAVDRAFDLETILKVSVGLRWDSMEPVVQEQLRKTFRRFTIATYVANFDKYDGERFRVMPGTRESGTDKIVKSEIVSMNGDPIRLDYVMRFQNNTWRIVDVLLDGSISRVAVQRSDFRKILANGDAQGLIDSLRRKITDLSEGALSS